jgi:hypothetical protein
MQVILSEFDLASCPKKLTNCKCCMTRFIYSRFFAGCGGDRSVFVDVLKVVTQK